MKLAHLVPAAALLLGSTGSFAINLGVLDLTSGSTGFSNTPVVGSFVDTATFTLTAAQTFNGSITSVVNGTQDVDFSSIVVSGPSGSFSFSLLNPDPVEVWATPALGFMLAAGSYTLTLTGVNSASAGSYGGNVAVTPALAVPEPGTYALMLAGIGALTLVARRRKPS